MFSASAAALHDRHVAIVAQPPRALLPAAFRDGDERVEVELTTWIARCCSGWDPAAGLADRVGRNVPCERRAHRVGRLLEGDNSRGIR